MMLVKVHCGDGVYDLYEAEGLSFLGQGCALEIPAEEDMEERGHRFSVDERFPAGQDCTHVVYTAPPLAPSDRDAGDPRIRLVRWVAWYTPGKDEKHLLVTDGPVFLCNERGDTVEALR